jgi:hypothetical protein
MNRRSMFLCLSIAMFSSLALASVHIEPVLVIKSSLFPEPHASQVASLALFGAGLLFAARSMESEKKN